jgi:hypothetical protein
MKSSHGTWLATPTWIALTSAETAEVFGLPTKSRAHPRIIIGRSEWLALPELILPPLRAKSDTGAKTSTLHAEDISFDETTSMVSFITRLADGSPLPCSCHAIQFRHIRNSGGVSQTRIVIRTNAAFAGGLCFPTEFTLADRSAMKHPILLGRSALNRRFLVDPQSRNLLGNCEVPLA